MKKIFNFCKVVIASSPILFAFNMVSILIITFCQFCMGYSFKLITDTIVSYDKSSGSVFSLSLPVLLFFFLICIGGNTFNFEDMLIAAYTNKAKKLFSKFFLYKSYKTKQDSFYNNEFYNNYQFVKDSLDNTSKITVSIFNKFTASLFYLILTSAVISYFNPLILIIILVPSIALIFLNKYIVNKQFKLNKDYVSDERHADYFSSLLCSKENSKELRIFGLRNSFINKYTKYFQRYMDAKFSFLVKSTLMTDSVGLIQDCISYILILYFLYCVYNKTLSVGDFVFINSILWTLKFRIANLINILSKDIPENYKYADSYEKFAGRVNLKALKEVSSYGVTNNPAHNEPFESLEFIDVCYKYPAADKNSTNHLNFKINKGEIVSILGYNGSGKTTFTKLMCGLLDDYTGQILLNGRDIKSYKKEDLYRFFGIGFQEFSKYSISLRDNVAVGQIESFNNDDMINDAIKKGNLKEVINRLPYGADTILGKEYDSKGQDLSGGQWQRIILSRAYMGSPDVLILDEPTAAIDPLEEMRMLNQFKDIVNGKTALLISHRIGFARISQKIAIMDNGHITEYGTHDELIALHGRYYELFMSQKHLYMEDTDNEK